MKLIHLSDIPKTFAHKSLLRQKIIDVGDLKTDVQTVNFVEMQTGETFAPHSHSDCEEYFFAIEGMAQANIAGNSLSFKKGDFLVVGNGEEHSITNNSKELFVYLAIRVLINE